MVSRGIGWHYSSMELTAPFTPLLSRPHYTIPPSRRLAGVTHPYSYYGQPEEPVGEGLLPLPDVGHSVHRRRLAVVLGATIAIKAILFFNLGFSCSCLMLFFLFFLFFSPSIS